MQGGAPTLVPVNAGGCPVRAVIFEVEGTASQVADIVYRREIHAVGSGKTYAEPAPDRTDAVRIAWFEGLAGFDQVLSTQLATNIDPLSAEILADLAIASAQALSEGQDGISYLIAAQASGIETPLSPHYAACILAIAGTATLTAALRAGCATASALDGGDARVGVCRQPRRGGQGARGNQGGATG